MIPAAIMFFVIALIATVLSLSGIAGVDVNIAWILTVAIIFVLICGVLGHPHQRKVP